MRSGSDESNESLAPPEGTQPRFAQDEGAAFKDLRLTHEEVAEPKRSGATAREVRGQRTVIVKLRLRLGDRQRVKYLGTDERQVECIQLARPSQTNSIERAESELLDFAAHLTCGVCRSDTTPSFREKLSAQRPKSVNAERQGESPLVVEQLRDLGSKQHCGCRSFIADAANYCQELKTLAGLPSRRGGRLKACVRRP